MWLEIEQRAVNIAISSLLKDDLESLAVQKKHKKHIRGFHFPCIIGHQRQHLEVRKDSAHSPFCPNSPIGTCARKLASGKLREGCKIFE
jgi:hypothetical protein